MIHSGETFACSQCDKSFSQLSHIKRHQTVHKENQIKEREDPKDFSQIQIQDAANENFIGSVLADLGLTLEGVVVYPNYTQ